MKQIRDSNPCGRAECRGAAIGVLPKPDGRDVLLCERHFKLAMFAGFYVIRDGEDSYVAEVRFKRIVDQLHEARQHVRAA